jgi:hypothetical protein
VVGGEFPEPVEMHNDHHTYYGCEGIDLAGLPVITGTMLPTTALQWPVSSKTDYSAHAKSDDNSYTTAAPSKSKRAASTQDYPGDSASSITTTSPLSTTTDVQEPTKPGPVVLTGPGRRHLTLV